MASFLGHSGVETCATAWLLAAVYYLQWKPLPDLGHPVDYESAIGVRSDYEGLEVEWIKVRPFESRQAQAQT